MKKFKLISILLAVTAIAFSLWIYRDVLPEYSDRAKAGAEELVDVSKDVINEVKSNLADDEVHSPDVFSEESDYVGGEVQEDGYKPIIFAKSYRHDKWKIMPRDHVKMFRAYIVSFDGEDDGIVTGNPEWVAYEMRKAPSNMPSGKAPKRPSRWIEDAHMKDIAPHDDSYKHSGYDRGHMCMKHIAWRLGANADWNTHTTINACPQIHKFNAGIWLDMEVKTQKWADKYGQIWVICGPIYAKSKKTIGDNGEDKVLVPDYFWKIIVRETAEGKLESIALLYPHKEIEKSSKGYTHELYLTTIDRIEASSGLDFFTELEDEAEEAFESKRAYKIWK